jgi:hypothetical protein
MPEQPLSDIARKILEYIVKNDPTQPGQVKYQSREEITGMLRLSLSEYDQACGELASQRLIVSDQPGSGDLDFIAPTPAGRQLV